MSWRYSAAHFGFVASMVLLGGLLTRVGGWLVRGHADALAGFRAMVALCAIGVGSWQLAGLI